MQGQLSDTSVADVLRAHGAEGRTGSLVVTTGTEVGTVWLRDGRIVGAASPRSSPRLGDRLVGAGLLEPRVLEEVLAHQRQVAGHPHLGTILVEQGLLAPHVIRRFLQEQALDALLELSRWRTGRFEFRPGSPPATPEIPFALSAPATLVEVARRSREWEELSRTIPDLDVVPFVEPASQRAIEGLEPDEFAVLAITNGESSVRDLAADLGYGEFETARIVYALVSLGMVRIGPSAEGRQLRPTASTPPSDEPGRSPPDATDTSDWRGPPPAQDDDSDVSELLRELSWLSRGGRGDAPPPPTPSPRRETEHDGAPTVRPSSPERQADQHDYKRRRRGLFGRR